MRTNVSIKGRDYIFMHPDNDGDFELIMDLDRAVHGEGVVKLCRALRKGCPGMGEGDWYAILSPDGGRCLSTLCRIPAEWVLRGGGACVALPCAEMGVVASAEDARGLGLSGWLIDRFKADSVRKGFLLSGIQGIPYFYRRFGYEFALPLMMSVVLEPGWNSGAAGRELPRIRPAVAGDKAALSRFFDGMEERLAVSAPRDGKHWDFLLGTSLESPETAVERFIIAGPDGEATGWLGVMRDCFGPTLALVECSLPDEAAGLTARAFLDAAEALRADWGLPRLTVLLDRGHPVSREAVALGGWAERGYGWQVSALDIPALLAAMAPALAGRLAASGFGGRPYELGLSFYGRSCALRWDGASLAAVAGEAMTDGDPALWPGAARIPPELVPQLALGFRSVDELSYARLDCIVPPRHLDFMNALFPRLEGFAYPQY